MEDLTVVEPEEKSLEQKMQDLQSGTTDSDRAKVLAAQELARTAMLDEMRQERNELVEHFNRDTDLKSKELV
jgi:hypothetical protein